MDLINNPNSKIIFDKIKPLIDEINKKRKLKGLMSRMVGILVLGVPNVRKSTLINKLVDKRVIAVGNKHGVTKNLVRIRINDKIVLLDSSGFLWSAYALDLKKSDFTN